MNKELRSRTCLPFLPLHGIKAAGSKRLSHSVFRRLRQRDGRIEKTAISRKLMNFTCGGKWQNQSFKFRMYTIRNSKVKRDAVALDK